MLYILAYNLGNFLTRLALPNAIKDRSLRSVHVRLIKMRGRLVRHARRLVFQLAEVAVPLALFQGVLDRIGRLLSGTWLKEEEGFSSVTGGSLGEVRLLRRPPGLTVDLDDD